MILAFDLDDTLYPEITYVKSGMAAVASHIEQTYGLDATECAGCLTDFLERDGRGQVFDGYLASVGHFSVSAVKKCVSIYRNHNPQISLFKETLPVLDALSGFPHYLVTDGNKLVQKRKICALAIESRFRKVFITHRFGLIHAKPSTYCFEKICVLENANWEELIYVGDNPHKDFVNLNENGAKTIRVRTGDFRRVIPKSGYDALYTIDHIRDLPKLIHHISYTL